MSVPGPGVAAILVLVTGCSASIPTVEPGHDVTAILGVTVVPMTGIDEVQPDHTVLIRGDRIHAVGRTGEVSIPSGARRIDGTGKYLIPGLADMHVHLEYFDESDVLTLFLANGVTTVRNMDGRDYIVEWKRAVSAGTLLGPSIHTAGPVLDGDPPLLPDNTVVRNADEAQSTVAEQASAGYDFVKVYTNLSTEAYHAILNAARQHSLPVAGHVPRQVDLADALSSGQKSIEHLGDYAEWVESDDSPVRGAWHWSKLYLAMPVDATKLTSAATATAASGVWIVPTMIQANRALALPDTVLAWLRAPEMAHVADDARSFWEERIGRATARMDDDDWLIVARGRLGRQRLVRALHDVGAGLLVGTDTPNPFVVPGSSLLEELENFVAAGLTPGETLVAATRDAARFLGELPEWGTIEGGKRADLVLLEADPLQDIRNVRRRAGVMVRGRWLSEQELRSMVSGLVLR